MRKRQENLRNAMPIRLTYRLPYHMAQAIRVEAEQRGMSCSALTRIAVEQYLKTPTA